ncbi:hypothetical protein DERP_006181 [Dermatophagoides pteronyssinus]|uniref:Uncharacterized protein n=1 Tax=Dermatophagoides pteronyssinus TaxID=6956 RepID=A0ABQ8IXQ3_DERPT|nr:hypothetical protein DERP_006181 [Dermatophagoides pteronyssinus]
MNATYVHGFCILLVAQQQYYYIPITTIIVICGFLALENPFGSIFICGLLGGIGWPGDRLLSVVLDGNPLSKRITGFP